MSLTPELYATVAALRPSHGLLIGGEWQSSDRPFPVDDPATGEVIVEVADGTREDATRAVDAAAGSLAAWSALPPRTRSDLLVRTRELMLRDSAALAALIAAENGKSQADARSEVTYAAEFFRWYAEEAVRPGGEYGESPAGGVRTVVTHRPVGVAALVTPWNFPAAMITRKVAPALAAGCTVVIKPAAETPLTALAIARLMSEAGVPDGVVNVVPTRDPGVVVGTWLADQRVRKLSFTGSTPVGRTLLRQAAQRVINTSLELGGCAPFIVTSDADLAAAVDAAMIAKFRNGGQACTSANTFYVHADIAAAFTAQLGARVEQLSVGPSAQGSDIGPLISAAAVQRVTRLVSDAERAGGIVAHRAAWTGTKGYFLPPTVVSGVDPRSELARDEIFAPVAPIVTWTDLDLLLDLVNANELGLASYVFAGDLGQALRIAERLEMGMVGVNRGLVSDPASPFGGTKQSGLGREGARMGLEEFLETQAFSVAW